MRDQPAAGALSRELRRIILDDMVVRYPQERIRLLMMANALGMIGREAEHGGDLDAALISVLSVTSADDGKSLVRSIRQGVFDADPQVHAALVKLSDVRTAISKNTQSGAGSDPKPRKEKS